MKDTHIQFLNEEINAANHLLTNSWNSPYREAYLHGKIYALKKVLEKEKRSKYNQDHARDSGQ
jgi:hypothetical protein